MKGKMAYYRLCWHTVEDYCYLDRVGSWTYTNKHIMKDICSFANGEAERQGKLEWYWIEKRVLFIFSKRIVKSL